MTDILLTDGMDLRIAGGDFVLGEAEQQDVHLILAAYPGEWRQYPLLGMGMADYLNSPADLARLQRDAAKALRYDGFTSTRVRVEPGGLAITANRNTAT